MVRKIRRKKKKLTKRDLESSPWYEVYLWNQNPIFYVAAKNKKEAERKALAYLKKHIRIEKVK